MVVWEADASHFSRALKTTSRTDASSLLRLLKNWFVPEMLERLFDDRAPFKWALLHAITTLAVRRAVHRQSVDLFAMRNPADLRLKAMMA